MVIGKKLKNINEENNFFYLTLALVILLLGSAMAQVWVKGRLNTYCRRSRFSRSLSVLPAFALTKRGLDSSIPCLVFGYW